MVELRWTTCVDELCRWREEVIHSVFGASPSRAVMEANREYYARHVASSGHLALIAAVDGREAGTGAVCLTEELPSPDNPSGRCAYLMNIYVRRGFRRRGVARAIVTRLVEEAKRRGCGKIYLESTEMARPLYRACGFGDMKNMMEYED